MWKCFQCGEQNEETFEVCWNCQFERASTNETENPSEQEADAESISESNSDESQISNEPAYLTRIELGALISRTLALLIFTICFFSGISFALAFTFALASIPWLGFTEFNSFSSIISLTLYFGALIAVGLFFWFKADSVGSKLVGGDQRPISGMPERYSDQILAAAIKIVGLVLAIDGLQRFAAIVYYSFRLRLDETPYWELEGLLEVVISLGLGLWLLLGSNGISKAITWLRSVGTPLSIHNSNDSDQLENET